MADTLVNVPFRTMVERCLKAVNDGAGQNLNMVNFFKEKDEGKSKEERASNESSEKENEKITTVVNSEVIKRFLKP
ncbi:MAG: hypothetical protein ACQETH_12390 [Candidatus Rifleibacteriota bacterium]